MSDSDSEIFELNNISGSEDESDFAPAAKKVGLRRVIGMK